jgi:hypothetical protein
VNLLIHCLNTWLIHELVILIARKQSIIGLNQRAINRLAFYVAGIWGLHPLNTMAVSYIYQRLEIL